MSQVNSPLLKKLSVSIVTILVLVSYLSLAYASGPVISSVQTGSLTTNSVQIYWQTNTPSDSRVAYGPSSGSMTASNSRCDGGGYVTSHCVAISGLAASTTYFYKVESMSSSDGTSGSTTWTSTSTYTTTTSMGGNSSLGGFQFTTPANTLPTTSITTSGGATTTTDTTTVTTPSSGLTSTTSYLPAAPYNLKVEVSSTTNDVYFYWADLSGNESYFELYEQALSGSWYLLTKPSANVTHYLYHSHPAGYYQYRLRACNSYGCSTDSNWLSVNFERRDTVFDTTSGVAYTPSASTTTSGTTSIVSPTTHTSTTASTTLTSGQTYTATTSTNDGSTGGAPMNTTSDQSRSALEESYHREQLLKSQIQLETQSATGIRTGNNQDMRLVRTTAAPIRIFDSTTLSKLKVTDETTHEITQYIKNSKTEASSTEATQKIISVFRTELDIKRAEIASSTLTRLNRADNETLKSLSTSTTDAIKGAPSRMSRATPILIVQPAEGAAVVAERSVSNAFKLDADQDGISDFDETHIYKTDPSKFDTNKDGIGDGANILMGANPVSVPVSKQKSDNMVVVGGVSLTPIIYEQPVTSVATTSLALKVESIIFASSTPSLTRKFETAANKVSTTSEAGSLVFKGKALANSFVTIYIYSTPIVVTVKTASDGTWKYVLDRSLENGEHTMYVAMTNASGGIVVKSEPTIFVKQAEAATIIPQREELSQGTKESVVNFLSVPIGISFLVMLMAVILVIIGFKATKNDPPVTPLS